MAFMRLGSKPEAFRRQGQTWLCTTGLVSDVTIEVGDMKFHLHKFPLLSRSGFLEKLLLIEESSSEGSSGCVLSLDEIPGGGKAFELVFKFCYGVKIELTAFNVVSLRCAAEYLDMTDNYGEGNIVGITETFLLNQVFGNWTNSIKALQTCEEVIDHAEDLRIISRCIDYLAIKACSDPSGKILQPTGEDRWFDDASSLSLPFFKRLIDAVEERGMKQENIAMAVMYYTRKHATTDDHLVIETPTMLAETLFDGYLAEVAPDVNYKPTKLDAIAAAVPDYARPLDDEGYQTIDEYMKANPWITDSEREHICRLMNRQMLSLEASTHAAHNERLPLRVIVQVLFSEQLKLRTSVSGWFFVARLSELENECMCLKQELQELVTSKKWWNFFTWKVNLKKKTEWCKAKDEAKPTV